MAKVTPTAKKLLLGKELAYLRDRAGLSQTQAAALIEKHQTKMTELESGQASITLGDLLLLLKGFGVTDEAYIEALLELRRGNHQRGKWTGIRSMYSESFRTMIDLEENCDLIRTVESEVPPGLLQCEPFIRSLFAHDPKDLDDRVKARLVRQEIFYKENPPQVAFVISEAALRRQYAPPEVMREQINYMIKLSKLPNIRLQVLPFKTRVQHTAIRDCFVLLRIPSPGAAGPLEFAYTENLAELRYMDDKRIVAAFDQSWARLTGLAMSFEETRRFMRKVAGEYS
ncbi:transcriptional regulator with XRE-family HTH domain [Saccharothrix tamanrassetensis]|uniref:Transcriptional regulator with XRE-family HTH domain n=1 Tax=Saccharothrix tamanrassetensis TaxID=1051531 RepID=A0A841CI52_9PSEU|nr:helix-turn-helix transcriptional regulator [Saccharothrix tamanrassetensis]MBB5955807.1 transcriptional regulator with XRE-family HTH domain [Saccharothrix tamanrassetensis]